MPVGKVNSSASYFSLPVGFRGMAFTTLRYWEGLPTQTRLLGALPLLTVSFFLTAALITALIV